MRLNQLRDNPGAKQPRKRVGRGTGSGTGTTAGRGMNGQKSRSGVAIKGFEGGQMPLHRRLPKRGFHNLFSKDYNEVNIGRIQQAVDAKKLDVKKPVNIEALIAAGIVRRKRDGVRLLGKGELTAKLVFEVNGVSKGAALAVEKAGGKVDLIKPKPKPEGRGKARHRAKAQKAEAKAKTADDAPGQKKSKPASGDKKPKPKVKPETAKDKKD